MEEKSSNIAPLSQKSGAPLHTRPSGRPPAWKKGSDIVDPLCSTIITLSAEDLPPYRSKLSNNMIRSSIEGVTTLSAMDLPTFRPGEWSRVSTDKPRYPIGWASDDMFTGLVTKDTDGMLQIDNVSTDKLTTLEGRSKDGLLKMRSGLFDDDAPGSNKERDYLSADTGSTTQDGEEESQDEHMANIVLTQDEVYDSDDTQPLGILGAMNIEIGGGQVNKHGRTSTEENPLAHTIPRRRGRPRKNDEDNLNRLGLPPSHFIPKPQSEPKLSNIRDTGCLYLPTQTKQSKESTSSDSSVTDMKESSSHTESNNVCKEAKSSVQPPVKPLDDSTQSSLPYRPPSVGTTDSQVAALSRPPRSAIPFSSSMKQGKPTTSIDMTNVTFLPQTSSSTRSRRSQSPLKISGGSSFKIVVTNARQVTTPSSD